MKTIHEFKTSKVLGDIGEAQLDSFFSKKFTITVVDLTLQKLGWDRIFIHPSGAVASVEYKTDGQASKTGNIFIEVWSNIEESKRGWAYTSTAQWLYYYLPDKKTVYVIDMVTLKMMLPKWEKDLTKKKAYNRSSKGNYHSEGILVPISKFKEVCYEEILIN